MNRKFLFLSAVLFVSFIEASEWQNISKTENDAFVSYTGYNKNGTKTACATRFKATGQYTASISGVDSRPDENGNVPIFCPSVDIGCIDPKKFVGIFRVLEQLYQAQ
ncbi:MAG: hypothetical protein LVQ75_02300 [Candidatus Babeliales bacterium]|jgi:hypothetical protein